MRAGQCDAVNTRAPRDTQCHRITHRADPFPVRTRAYGQAGAPPLGQRVEFWSCAMTAGAITLQCCRHPRASGNPYCSSVLAGSKTGRRKIEWIPDRRCAASGMTAAGGSWCSASTLRLAEPIDELIGVAADGLVEHLVGVRVLRIAQRD